MHASTPAREAIDRTIHLRLTPKSLAPRVLPALETLGYTLLDRESVAEGSGPKQRDRGFWLVDDSRLADVPDPALEPRARILLIGSKDRPRLEDDRIRAQTERPARLSAIYSMIQHAIENTPRRTPRVHTQLSARCIRAERRSIGAVLQLSEGGCLLRTYDTLRKGNKIDIQFALPEYGLVSTPAYCRYTRQGNAGMEFSSPPPDIRLSIAHYVTLQLAMASQGDKLVEARSA